jgi:hypothetical protein
MIGQRACGEKLAPSAAAPAENRSRSFARARAARPGPEADVSAILVDRKYLNVK